MAQPSWFRKSAGPGHVLDGLGCLDFTDASSQGI